MELYLLIGTIAYLAIGSFAISNLSLSFAFFCFSPLFPEFIRPAFNLPALNDTSFFLFFFLLSLIKNRKRLSFEDWERHPLCLPILAAFLVILMGGLRSMNLPTGPGLERVLITYVLSPLLMTSTSFWAIFQGMSFERKKADIVFIATLILLTVAALYDHFFMLNNDSKLAGFIGSYSKFSSIILIAVPYVFWMSKYTKFKRTYFSLGYLLICSLLLMGSRSALLVMLIVGSYFVYHNYPKKVFFISFMMFLCLTCFFFRDKQILSQAMDKWGDWAFVLPHLSNGRTEIWEVVLHHLSYPLHLLIGGGTDHFLYFSSQHKHFVYGAHNIVLKVLVDYGVVGLAIFGWLFKEIVSYSLRQYKGAREESQRDLAKAFLYTTVIFLSLGMFHHFTLNSRLFAVFWYIFGVLLVSQLSFSAPSEEKNFTEIISFQDQPTSKIQ